MDARKKPGTTPGIMKLDVESAVRPTAQRYDFCPKYDYNKAGIQEDINFVGRILNRLTKEVGTEIERLTLKVESGQKWAADIVSRLNAVSELICNAYEHLFDVSGYPASLRMALADLRELGRHTLVELVLKHIRMTERKPYGVELAQRANMIDTSVLTARYYVSRVLEFFPKEKEVAL